MGESKNYQKMATRRGREGKRRKSQTPFIGEKGSISGGWESRCVAQGEKGEPRSEKDYEGASPYITEFIPHQEETNEKPLLRGKRKVPIQPVEKRKGFHKGREVGNLGIIRRWLLAEVLRRLRPGNK